MPPFPPRPLLFAFFLPAATAWGAPVGEESAEEETVEVPGVGVVPLEDARATCTNGVPIGALAEAPARPREAALVTWGRDRLAQGADDGSWPHRALDLTYTDVEIPWIPPGVVPSCWAVARHEVARGLELRRLCSSDRASCRDRFTAAEREIVKDALKAKVRGRKDAMFAQLAALPDLTTWRSPTEALDRACAWPQQASMAGRFVDTDDLAAARAACVQLLELLTGAAASEVAALPCAGDWATVPAEVLLSPDTDLGTLSAVEVASSVEVKLATIRDKLTRMNPSAAPCDPSAVPAEQRALAAAFGTTWSSGLAEVFEEAQTTRACVDERLPLPHRLELCPTLAKGSEASCRRGDPSACDLLARLHLEGIGMEADEEAAFDVWQRSCNASHAPACEVLRQRKDRIQAWFDAALQQAQALAEAPPAEASADPFATASDLLTRFGSALGPEWVSEGAAPLFDAALEAQREKEANDILTMYGATLGEAWGADARARLGKLQEVLKRRSGG